MTTWHIYTDGSCIQGSLDPSSRSERKSPDRATGPGGWAAIIEHGSDGFVVRGRERDTTNTRMELRAMIEGLRQVPAYEDAVLHVDCSVALIVKERWARHQLPSERNAVRDQPLWLELGREFDRVRTRIELIGKGGHPVHLRAHVIAGTEARALQQGLPTDATLLENPPSRRERRDWFLERDGLRAEVRIVDARQRREQIAWRQAHGLRHEKACDPPNRCVSYCPVWSFLGYPSA